jgi:DNA-binding NtrC family response regulator
MPTLLLLTGPLAGRRYQLTGEAILGRSTSCEISLQDNKVSRKHARIVVEERASRIEDLGSRNGTLVNGQRISGTVGLAPGDQVQVGDTTALFDPPAKASLTDRSVEVSSSVPVEELLPRVGGEATLFSLSAALLSATSEGMVLRRTVEEVARGVNADRAAAMLAESGGLMTASVVGAKTVDVPRAIARAALEHREISAGRGALCAPLVPAGGQALGLLYCERAEPFTQAELALAATVGRIAGEALATVRLRTGRGLTEPTLVGSTKAFRRALEDARRAAVSEQPVVLYGEVGTGRAATAWLIHALSPRSLGPFVVVDCRQEAREVEQDLFGMPGGPASPPRASALLRADGGTLLLRDLHGLPRTLADRLSQHLQKRTAPAPQGGDEPVDVRILCSAVQQLPVLAERDQFDRALAQAVAGNEIELSPLKGRQGDVPALFDHFAGLAARASHQAPPTLTPEARRLLTEYAWPGNVLELKLMAERLALLYPGGEIPALRLPSEVQHGGTTRAKSLDELISNLEREAISEALREARGKKIRAAALLGISRPTLDKKIEDYGLTVQKVRGRSRRPAES